MLVVTEAFPIFIFRDLKTELRKTLMLQRVVLRMP